MKNIKVVIEYRHISCPICEKSIDTWTGNSCTHLQKIIIRTDKKHVAIFNK